MALPQNPTLLKFHFLSSITGTKRSPESATAPLLLNYKHWPKVHLPFVIHFLIVTKKSITLGWKQPDPSEFNFFLIHLNTETQFELMFSIKNCKSQWFCAQWSAWLHHSLCSVHVMVTREPPRNPLGRHRCYLSCSHYC